MHFEKSSSVIRVVEQQKACYESQHKDDPDFRKPKSTFMHYYEVNEPSCFRFRPHLKPS